MIGLLEERAKDYLIRRLGITADHYYTNVHTTVGELRKLLADFAEEQLKESTNAA